MNFILKHACNYARIVKFVQRFFLMTNSNDNKYKASNVGGLMIEDSIRVFKYLYNNGDKPINIKELEMILPIKSENSRKRIFQEITKRYQALDKNIADYFVNAYKNEQIIILYFTALKIYKLLYDVVFELVIPKYLKNESSINKMDILSFLDTKLYEQPHIDKWSIRTRNNMASVMLMFLKEAGIQKKDKILALQANVKFWKLFANTNNKWMFDASLLSTEIKTQIKTNE